MNTQETGASTSSRRAIVRLVSAAVTAWALVAAPYASAQEDPGYRAYRCAVLGDSLACPRAPAVSGDRVEVHVVPGAYALYLIHLGQDSARAIEAVRAIGEVPSRRVVRVTSRQLTDLEKYEQYLGRLAVPEVRREILSEAPADETNAQAGR